MEEQLMFASREEFRQWLTKNHDTSKGIWLIFGKAGKIQSVKPDEALEEALCFGWIDGQFKSIDETKYIKKFTPRKKNSQWSEKNRSTAIQLMDRGLMTEYGLAAIEQAKKSNNRDMPKREPVSEEQIAALADAIKNFEPAYSNFMKMSASVKKTYTLHYLAAKSEDTKKKRLQQIIERLNENKKPM
jgi:uncharacterized protein YdeI (YjbR/CyaY-like superfamily)